MIKKFNNRFKELIIEAVANSFNERMCNKLGERIEPLFNIHKISGISEKITMQPMIMAKNFVDYFFSKNQHLTLVNELFKASIHGIDGYDINIYNINTLKKELEKTGYIFDKDLCQIVYVDQEKKLTDWGVLEEGKEYSFCFISVDIVKNSRIVRIDNPKLIKETYKNFYRFINDKITSRNGRIWSWEGDGGIIAFYGEDAINKAIFGVMDFYLSMPVFNTVFNKIKHPIIPRIAAHYGKSVYKNNIHSIKSDTLETTKEIEKSYTASGEFVITNIVLISLMPQLKTLFKPLKKEYKHELFKLDLAFGRCPTNE